MKLHADSHVDHVPAEVVAYIVERFANRDGFLIETIDLPPHLPEVRCDLHGPEVGDLPIPDDDWFMAHRGGRQWPSKMTGRKPRMTRVVTFVAGPYQDESCVLFTVHGGPKAPREVNDPSLVGDDAIDESAEFWSTHALSYTEDS